MADKKIQTCDICKVRHQKCDGIRPSCHHCKIRGLECVYSTYSAKPRGASSLANINSARSKRNAPPGGRSSATGAYREPLEVEASLGAISENGRIEGILREELAALNIPSTKRNNLIQSIMSKIHTAAHPSLIDAEAPTDEKPAPLDAVSTDMLIRLFASLISVRVGQHPSVILDNLPAFDDVPFVPIMIPVAFGHTFISTPLDHSPTREEARKWVDTFLDGPNTMAYVVAPDACRNLLRRFYELPETLNPKDICLMKYVLAVGARYSDHVQPKSYLQWAHWAHCQLEYCLNHIKGSQLWLLQPLLLRCLIAVHTSPSTAWLILGMASRIAQLYRLDQDFELGGPLDVSEYDQWHPLWGTIVYLDVWLSVVLARLPAINISNSRYAPLHNISSAVEIPESSFQNSIARLGVLLGLILRDVYCINDAHSNVHEVYLRLHQSWAENLPASLRFQQADSEASQSEQALKLRDQVGSQYLELMYLNNLMILTQPLVQAWVSSKGNGKPAQSSDSWSTVKICIESAARIGVISADLGRDRAICKRAWLVSTMNYHAALVLLNFLAFKECSLLSNASSPAESTSELLAVRGLAGSVQVLQFCGRADPYAKHLQNVIQFLWSKLGATPSNTLSYDNVTPASFGAHYGFLSNHVLPNYGPEHASNGVATQRHMPALDVQTLKHSASYADLPFSPTDMGAYSSSHFLGAEHPYDTTAAASYYHGWPGSGFPGVLPPQDPHDKYDPDYHMQ